MDHEIIIDVENDEVGNPTDEDGVMLLLIEAVGVGATFVLNTPYLITDPSDLPNVLGIDPATYDNTNGTDLVNQVQDFYNQSGTGAYLWIVGIAIGTGFATYAATDTFDDNIRFTAQNDPLMRVKILGTSYAPPTALQNATDFPADVMLSVAAIFAKQQALFQEGYEFSFLVDGYNMSSTVTPTNLTSLATRSEFAASVNITGLRPNGVSAMGAALGRFARITVGHGVGQVSDGPVFGAAAFLTNSISTTPASVLVVGNQYLVLGGAIIYNAITYPVGSLVTVINGHTNYTTTQGGYLALHVTPVGSLAGTTVQGLRPADIKALGQKQFFFLRWWFGKSGFFWNDGATCNPPTKAFSSQEYNRVVNKLSADARAFFIEQMGSGLPVDKTTGNVAQGWLNSKQQQFYNQYILPLTTDSGTGDLSDASLTVTGNNFLATKTLTFSLEVVPTVILGSVTGTVRFVAKLG